MENVAYTDAYKLHRESFDKLFELEPESCEDLYLGENNEYIVKTTTFTKTEIMDNNIISNHSVNKVTVLNKQDEIILEFKSIDDNLFIKVIHHSNGNDYLIFRIDLYGYSIMDLTNNNISHYIPKASFDEREETFIWTDALYCEVNDLLVIDGCYWAAQWTNEFYDFSNPMQLPFNLYCDGYEMEKYLGMDINCDILTTGFTDKGECIIKGADEEGVKAVKVIDVIEWSKNKYNL